VKGRETPVLAYKLAEGICGSRDERG
jgi:hypothetical protein